jgi:hypothetical protein
MKIKNWKTTLLGAVGAALTAVTIYAKSGGDLADWKLYVIPALIAAFGYVSKDAGVTGTGI